MAVSAYSCVDYRRVTDVLEENNIKHALKTFKWIKMGEHTIDGRIKFHNFTEQELCDVFNKCGNSRWCHAVVDNKLFICYRTANLWLDGYPIDENKYVSLTLEYHEKRKGIEDIYRHTYSWGCNYCGMTNPLKEWTEPAEQMQ